MSWIRTRGTKWGATALLAQASIERGMFTYAYSPELRRRLHNPAMYARLISTCKQRFKSKYGLALWELCADYLGSGREYGRNAATFRWNLSASSWG